MLYESKFLLFLLLTLVVEIPILFVIVRFIFKKGDIGKIRIIGVGILSSSLTLPYLWFILPPFIDSRYYLYIGESLVILVEALIINQLLGLDMVKSFAASFIMNACSFLFGLLFL